ncbi:MAG: hypothetical protein ACO2PP_04180 [Thermocrinis sp.]|jgi:hypothetical protein|uniref:hypothetical protein n=1 Tax=Thermocrinis sp. TaxID=2024383 RepID=UPI003C0898DF
MAEDKVNRNSIPEGGKSQGGGRQTVLLPQKTRKWRSREKVSQAYSQGFRGPAYVPVHRFLLFVQEGNEWKPKYTFEAVDPRSIAQVVDFALENNLSILYHGTFFLDRETRRKLQENRQKAKGDRKKIAELDRQALFGHDRLARVAFWVFIDIDNKDEHALRKLVKYLRKMGISPEVWETQNGYHVYIYFYYRKEYQYVEVKDEDGKTRVEKVFVGYILPYANNYKIGDVEKALKHICSKLSIEADIVSAKHSVWMEGVPNPIKGGFATKLLRKGYPLSLEDLWQKMLNVLIPLFYRKPRSEPKPKSESTDVAEEALRELDRLLDGQHSNVFCALRQHGTLKACRQLWKAGYDLFDIEFELRKRLDIRNRSDEIALQNFLDYFYTHYTDIERPYVRQHKKKERKHEHYYEFAEQVKGALEKGYLRVADIARYLCCARHKVENLQRFLRKHGYDLVDLLSRYEEVMAFLKEHAKGGNKWHKKDKEAWLEEMQQKKAEYIQWCKEEAEKRRAKKRAELEAKGIDPDRWRQAPVLFPSIPYIGYQVYDRKVVGGFVLTNRPPQTSKKQMHPSSPPRAGRQQRFTPAVPLVILSRDYSTQLRDALYEVLQKYHSEDGLPVVLVVPSRFSDTGSTSLKLAPYKVPPRNFRQLWQEIREKFGKTVQGLSTRNGALDWFLKVWDQVKDKTTLVSVPSTPFPIKKERPSIFSYLLSAKQLLTEQAEPPEKKDEKKDNNKAVLSGAELAELMSLFRDHPDKKISELMPYMSERVRQVLKQVKREVKGELDYLSELKAKGELPPLLQRVEGFVCYLDDCFPRLLHPPVIFCRLFDAILRNYEKIYGPDPLFLELRRVGSFFEFTETVYLKRKALEIPKSKGEPEKLTLPPSEAIEDVVRFFEGRRSQVSRQELETAIYAAWQKVDKDKADRLAVSRCIDRYEGVLWKKLNNGHYCLLVSSDKVRARIRDYVRELKKAKKNGQGQTSADGNGSLGSTSLPTNGNGKYDIDQIIHTLQKEGKVYVPPQFVHEIVRELKRAGLSVNYWTTTGLIELAGGEDELPF